MSTCYSTVTILKHGQIRIYNTLQSSDFFFQPQEWLHTRRQFKESGRCAIWRPLYTHILPVTSMLTQPIQSDNSPCLKRITQNKQTQLYYQTRYNYDTPVKIVNWRQIYLEMVLHAVCSVVIQGKWDWERGGGDMRGTKICLAFLAHEWKINQQLTTARLSCISKLWDSFSMYFMKERRWLVYR